MVSFECIRGLFLWIKLGFEVYILFQVSHIVVDLTVFPIPQSTLCISPYSNGSGAIPECGIGSSVPLVGDNLCQSCTYVQKSQHQARIYYRAGASNLEKVKLSNRKKISEVRRLEKKARNYFNAAARKPAHAQALVEEKENQVLQWVHTSRKAALKARKLKRSNSKKKSLRWCNSKLNRKQLLNWGTVTDRFFVSVK